VTTARRAPNGRAAASSGDDSPSRPASRARSTSRAPRSCRSLDLQPALLLIDVHGVFSNCCWWSWRASSASAASPRRQRWACSRPAPLWGLFSCCCRACSCSSAQVLHGLIYAPYVANPWQGDPAVAANCPMLSPVLEITGPTSRARRVKRPCR